jgi:tetratricopeptide (TPR) repeat protein
VSFFTNLYGTIGLLSHSKGNLKRAEKYYRKAIQGGGTAAQTFAGLTGVLIRNGKYQEAYDVITDGLEKAKVKKKNKLAIKSLTSQYVISLWKLGRLDEAIEEMEKIHQELPSANSFGTLGYFYIERGDKTGDYSKAIDFNKEAVAYADDDATILDNLAQAYYRVGSYDEAEPLFRKALEEKENQVDSLYYLAKVRVARGDTGEARELVERALRQNVLTTSTVSADMLRSLKVEIENR